MANDVSPVNDVPPVKEAKKIGGRTMALFLLLIIVAIALGIVGVVVKGLIYILIIGVVVLLADLFLVGLRLRRSGRRRSRPGR